MKLSRFVIFFIYIQVSKAEVIPDREMIVYTVADLIADGTLTCSTGPVPSLNNTLPAPVLKPVSRYSVLTFHNTIY